jgi:ankyrin repeat protein
MPGISRLLRFSLPLAGAALLVSCDTPQKRALRELAAAGVEASGHSLVLAVLRHDLPQCRLLLDAGVFTEQRDSLGRTPLRIAVDIHEPQLALHLIAAKANINATTADEVSILGVAVANDHAAVVEKLLSSGARADGRMPDGETILPWAIRAGHLALVRMMMQAGADPHLKDQQGNPLLHIAMNCGRRDLVDSLIALGADPGAVDAHGESTLHFALRHNWLDAVPRLIAGGADPNLPSPAGRTPLEQAISAHDPGLLELLLKCGAEPNSPGPAGFTPLEQALTARDQPLLDLLLKGGANPNLANPTGSTPLERAITARDPALLGVLLKGGANPDLASPAGVTPLQHAIASRDPYMLGLLLQAGANPDLANPAGLTPLELAIRSRESSLLDPLLQSGADPNRPGRFHSTAVHAAIRARWTEGMQVLAAARADFNLPDATGITPLQQACTANDRELLGRLLSYRAKPGSLGARGRLLVEEAAATGNGSIVKLLLDYGSPAGNALFAACLRGDDAMAGLLLACGVAPDASRVPTYDLPLGAALRAGNDLLAAALVARGADTRARLAEGQSPLILAIARGCHQTVKCLLDAGANPNAPLRYPISPAFIRQIRPGVMQWELRMDRNLTALMLAADSGESQTAMHLIAAGAKKNVWTRFSQMGPLNFAVQRADVKMLRALLGQDPEREERRIVISLSEQRARMFDLAGNVMFDTKVSTGRKGFATRTGDFVITDKNRVWTSTIYHASMPYFQRLSCSDFGLHQGYVPGYPASHGCIRVPADRAAQLFGITRVGDRVQIVP